MDEFNSLCSDSIQSTADGAVLHCDRVLDVSNGTLVEFPDAHSETEIDFSRGGVLLLSFVVVGSSINGEVSCSGAVFGRYPFLFLLDGIAGSMGFILITIATGKKNSFLEFYGRNSLTILCTHLILIDLFWVFNSQVLHLSLRAVDARLFAIGVILLEAPMIHIINKYFPWLIGLKKQRNGQD